MYISVLPVLVAAYRKRGLTQNHHSSKMGNGKRHQHTRREHEGRTFSTSSVDEFWVFLGAKTVNCCMFGFNEISGLSIAPSRLAPPSSIALKTPDMDYQCETGESYHSGDGTHGSNQPLLHKLEVFSTSRG